MPGLTPCERPSFDWHDPAPAAIRRGDVAALGALPGAAGAMAALPVVANADHAPLEGGEDPAFGTLRWRTLFSADRTETRGMVLGIAEFGPEGTLLPHRHAPSEIYYGLAGAGVVTVEVFDVLGRLVQTIDGGARGRQRTTRGARR